MCVVLQVKELKGELKIRVSAPSHPDFSDLKPGDSVAVDGVCLTLEQISPEGMDFHIGPETLKITNWSLKKLKGKKVNLEPSLRKGDFIGGHFVSGHVDGVAKVMSYTNKGGESQLMKLKVPSEFKERFWKKAFITLNGVSLTINEVSKDVLSFCLVPATLERTNLQKLKPGDLLTFETDILTHSQ